MVSFSSINVLDLKTKWDLWAMPMTGSDRTVFPVADTPFAERMGQFSPDGRWVAYAEQRIGTPRDHGAGVSQVERDVSHLDWRWDGAAMAS